MHPLRNLTVISGGQTGVDRAALDAAGRAGLNVGGWCPKGRCAEDGIIPGHYPLQEMRTTDYAARTIKNVLESDGTLILQGRQRSAGTDLTEATALRAGKPVLRCDPDLFERAGEVVAWLLRHHIRVLNIAGPRASEAPHIYASALDFLTTVFEGLTSPDGP